MPPLHSPKVGAIVPSVSIKASLKKPLDCSLQTRCRTVLVISIKSDDILLLKTTGEVPAGGRVRNALGAQTIEESLIIAPQLNIILRHLGVRQEQRSVASTSFIGRHAFALPDSA